MTAPSLEWDFSAREAEVLREIPRRLAPLQPTKKDTHDLGQLAEASEQNEPSLSGWTDRLLPLADFGVAQRYP